ncbi:MAG TPA: PAS domain-containing protein [Mucilaginibacter sp.]|nr:PAS domain-containing protein [Mucilaginibacter sp.]
MLQHLLSALSEAVIAFDITDQKLLFFSDAVCAVTGRGREQFEQNMGLLEAIVHPDDVSRIKEQASEMAVPGEMELSFRIITPGGQVKWVREKCIYLTDEENGHTVHLHILADISDQIAYRTVSERKVWFLSSLVDAIAALVFRVDTQGRYTFVNDIYTRHLGYRREELIGKPMSDFLYADDYATLSNTITNCLAHPGSVFHIRHRKRTKNGQLRWIATDAVAVQNRQGKATEIQGVALDITDLYQAREDLLHTKNNLEALINNTEDLIWSVDDGKNYISVNAAYQKWVTNHHKFEPQPGMSAIRKEVFVIDWEPYYNRVLAGERFTVVDKYICKGSNTSNVFEISFNPILSAEQKVIGAGCFARDITEQLAKQQSIEMQNEQLTEIASLSSHELRRPIANLLGLIPLFDYEHPGNSENIPILKNVAASARELDDVVQQIVDQTFIKTVDTP